MSDQWKSSPRAVLFETVRAMCPPDLEECLSYSNCMYGMSIQLNAAREVWDQLIADGYVVAVRNECRFENPHCQEPECVGVSHYEAAPQYEANLPKSLPSWYHEEGEAP